MDEGFLTLANGKTVQASGLPIEVYASEGTKQEWVVEAVDWWNKTLSRDGVKRTAFKVGSGYRAVPVYADHYIMPESSVPPEYNDWWNLDSMEDPRPLGRCTAKVDTASGHISDAMIELNWHYAYYDRVMILALKQEMGHLLGLADDRRSIDLASIMSEGLIWDGRLTPWDFDRLVIAYERWW
jgi:hypothetical protein